METINCPWCNMEIMPTANKILDSKITQNGELREYERKIQCKCEFCGKPFKMVEVYNEVCNYILHENGMRSDLIYD